MFKFVAIFKDKSFLKLGIDNTLYGVYNVRAF